MFRLICIRTGGRDMNLGSPRPVLRMRSSSGLNDTKPSCTLGVRPLWNFRCRIPVSRAYPLAVALRRIARLPLVTNGEHQYNVLPSLITIERHVATLAIGDQEFPQSLLTWSADKRMSLKNLDSVANYIDRCDSSLWCILDEKIGQSLQVGKRVSGVDYFRHVRTFGRFARSPRTRAAK